jgi:hypothetical protein
MDGQEEYWYELTCAQDEADPETYFFALHLARVEAQLTPPSILVQFGTFVCRVHIDPAGNAMWSLPATVVLDPKHKRLMRPVLVHARND